MTAGREGGQWKFLSAIMEAREGYCKSPYPTDASRRGWGVGAVKDSITVQDKLAKEVFKTLTFDF